MRNPRTGTIIWSALVNTVGHKNYCLEDERRYLASQRNESQGSSELSFQLNTDPNLTVPDPSAQLLGAHRATSSQVIKRLTYMENDNANNTTVPNPELGGLAMTDCSMPEISSDDIQKVFEEDALQIYEGEPSQRKV